MEATLNAADAGLVLCATPVDLGQLIDANRPKIAVEYEPPEREDELAAILKDFDYYKLAGG